MEYILKSSVALSLAYLLYFLFIRKNFNLKWLRIYFLAALVFSLTLPALKYLPDFHQKNIISVSSDYIPEWIEESPSQFIISSNPEPKQVTSSVKYNIYDILTGIYLIGALLVLIRFVAGILYLLILAIKNQTKKLGKYYFVLVDKQLNPFSFFKFIFINKTDLADPQKEMIIEHEKVHIKQRHSIDMILLEIVSILQWFNPFAWLLRRELKGVHEFLADIETIKNQDSILDYQKLLLSQVYGTVVYIPANTFHNSLTKKRIIMISKNHQNRKWFAVLFLLIIATTLTTICSRTGVISATSNPMVKFFVPEKKNQAAKVDNKNTANCNVKYDTVASPIKNDSAHKTIIYKSKNGSLRLDAAFSAPAYFKGNNCFDESAKAYDQFIKENLKYPEELKDKEISGTVEVIYEISETGKVKNVKCNNDGTREYYKNADEKYKNDPAKLNRIHEHLSSITDNPYLVAEAVRVISHLPDFTPAKNKAGKAVKCIMSEDILFIGPNNRKINDSFRTYIDANQKYPKDALERKAEGTVHLKFDLDKDGRYGNIRLGNEDSRKYYISKGLTEDIEQITDDPSLVKEAIRLLKERPGYYIENFDTINRAMWGSCSIDFHLPK